MTANTVEKDEKVTSTGIVKRLGGVTGKGFMPGVASNPGGRPKGIAAYVREATGDGKRAVDIAVSIMMADPAVTQDGRMRISPELQLDAAKWLIDRGYGRAVNPVEITGLDGGPIQRLDLTVLATTDLDQLESILSKSAGGSGHGSANSVDNAPSGEET